MNDKNKSDVKHHAEMSAKPLGTMVMRCSHTHSEGKAYISSRNTSKRLERAVGSRLTNALQSLSRLMRPAISCAQIIPRLLIALALIKKTHEGPIQI